MKNIIVSIALTLLLGPGAGHLYLRQFKRALMFICTTVFFAVSLAWMVAKDIAAPQLKAAAASQLFQSYVLEHPTTILYFDTIFAALWAYALVDAFFQSRAMMPAAPEQESNEE